jgi:hypothetical protein
MKYAIVNGQREEAQPSLAGECPACDGPMIAKCGKVRAWHWAHEGLRDCDPWWEPETDWHRNWKDQFPVDWQEIIQHAEDGRRHIADVKTDDGWVIEFQHSPIEPDERLSREVFYSKLVWVVNGLRRKRDKGQFLKAWEEGTPVAANSQLRGVSPGKCVLLREWAESSAPVFFDIGETQKLGWLLPKRPGGRMYVFPFAREMFVGIHRATATQMAHDFHSFMEELGELVATYESSLSRRRGLTRPIWTPRTR